MADILPISAEYFPLATDGLGQIDFKEWMLENNVRIYISQV